MVIMEIQQNMRTGSITREKFNNQLTVAASQYKLTLPCLLRGQNVDLFKLYIFGRRLRSNNNGNDSYISNEIEWRRIADLLGFKGDKNAEQIYKIYNKYIRDSYERSASNLSGASPKSLTEEQPPRRVRRVQHRKPPPHVVKLPHPQVVPAICNTEPVAAPSPTQPTLPAQIVEELTDVGDQKVVRDVYSDTTYLVDDEILPDIIEYPDKIDVEPLIRQLESELPHEQRFALNVLLWASKTWPLPLGKYPKIIPALLINTGYVPGDLYRRYWEDKSMERFWNEKLEDETYFNDGYKSEKIIATQVGTIFYNLSLVPSNAEVLGKNRVFLQYILQATQTSALTIRNTAYEILSNIVAEISYDILYELKDRIFPLFTQCLTSQDRFLLVTGLNCLANVTSRIDNHILLDDYIKKDNIEVLLRILLIEDVQILHSALEAIYSITSIGASWCELLLSFPYCISTLTRLFARRAEDLHHTNLKVVSYRAELSAPKTPPTVPPQNLKMNKPVLELKATSIPDVVKANLRDMQTTRVDPVSDASNPVVDLALSWIRTNLKFSKNSIILKTSVYVKYRKAVNRQDQVSGGHSRSVIPAKEFFGLLTDYLPKMEQIKIQINNNQQLALKNVDWIKIVNRSVGTSTPSSVKTVGTQKKQPINPVKSTELKKPCKEREILPKPTLLSTTDPSSSHPPTPLKTNSPEKIIEKNPPGIKTIPSKKKAVVIEEDMHMEYRSKKIIGAPTTCLNNKPLKRTYLRRVNHSPNINNNPFDRPTATPSPFATETTNRQYNEYKKTTVIDLRTTPEKRKYDDDDDLFDEAIKTSSHLESTSEKPTSPTFDQPSSLAFSGKSPTFDKCGSPDFEKSKSVTKSPTFDKTGSPTLAKTESPTLKRMGSPTFDKAGSPTFDKGDSPTFEKNGPPTFDKTGSPTFEKPGSPTFDKIRSPTFDKTETSTVRSTESPTFDNTKTSNVRNTESPTFDSTQTLKKSFEKDGSPIFENAKFLSLEKSGSPTHEKTEPPTLNTKSITFRIADSLSLDKSTTHEKSKSPSLATLTSPTLEKSRLPVMKQAELPSLNTSKCATFERVQPNFSESKPITGAKRKLTYENCVTMKVTSPVQQNQQDIEGKPKNGDDEPKCNGIFKKLRIDNDILVATPHSKSSEILTNASYNDSSFPHTLAALPDGNLDLFEESEKKNLRTKSVSTNTLCRVTNKEILTTGTPTKIRTCFTESPKRNGVIRGKILEKSPKNIPPMSIVQTKTNSNILPNQTNQIIVPTTTFPMVIPSHQSPNRIILPATPIVSSPLVPSQVVCATQQVVITSPPPPSPVLVQVPTSPIVGRMMPQSTPILLASGASVQSILVNSSTPISSTQTTLLPSSSNNTNPIILPQVSQPIIFTTSQLIDNNNQQIAFQNNQPIVIASPQKPLQKQLLVPVSIVPQVTNLVTARDFVVSTANQTTTTPVYGGNSVTSSPLNHSFNLPAQQGILSPSNTVLLIDGTNSSNLNPTGILNPPLEKSFKPVKTQENSNSPKPTPITTTRTTTQPTTSLPRKRKLVLPTRCKPYPCYWETCTKEFGSEAELASHILTCHVNRNSTCCLWATCKEPPNTRTRECLVFHVRTLHSKAPLLTTLPSFTYDSTKMRKLLSGPVVWRKEPESPITKSLRLLISLIIRNLLYYTPEFINTFSQYEELFALMAMSEMESSRVSCDILDLCNDVKVETTQYYMTHLPPFR